jgi:uncharacterized protein GlcG (DUF336 family)
MQDVIESGILSLAGAQRVLYAALTAAQARGASIAVAVCGPGGDLQAFARMDGASPLAGETARRKCWTVSMTRRPTRDTGESLQGYLSEEPQVFYGILRIGDIAAFPGGIPIRSGEHFVGAVAVSGGSSGDDHEIAELAAAAIST